MGTVSFGTAGAVRSRAARWPGMAVFIFIGAAFAAAGAAVLAGLPWQEARLHLAARSWPVADATILSVSLHEERRPGPHGVEEQLVLSVVHTFEVDGIAFTGRRAGLSDRAAPHDRDLKTLFRRLDFARLTGRTVPVSYDPDDPAHAYLDIGFAWRPAALKGGLGLAAVLLGLTVASGAARARRAAASV